jgi:hypothetical protein
VELVALALQLDEEQGVGELGDAQAQPLALDQHLHHRGLRELDLDPIARLHRARAADDETRGVRQQVPPELLARHVDLDALRDHPAHAPRCFSR